MIKGMISSYCKQFSRVVDIFEEYKNYKIHRMKFGFSAELFLGMTGTSSVCGENPQGINLRRMRE